MWANFPLGFAKSARNKLKIQHINREICEAFNQWNTAVNRNPGGNIQAVVQATPSLKYLLAVTAGLGQHRHRWLLVSNLRMQVGRRHPEVVSLLEKWPPAPAPDVSISDSCVSRVMFFTGWKLSPGSSDGWKKQLLAGIWATEEMRLAMAISTLTAIVNRYRARTQRTLGEV